jgi:hypothetical protein
MITTGLQSIGHPHSVTQVKYLSQVLVYCSTHSHVISLPILHIFSQAKFPLKIHSNTFLFPSHTFAISSQLTLLQPFLVKWVPCHISPNSEYFPTGSIVRSNNDKYLPFSLPHLPDISTTEPAIQGPLFSGRLPVRDTMTIYGKCRYCTV